MILRKGLTYSINLFGFLFLVKYTLLIFLFVLLCINFAVWFHMHSRGQFNQVGDLQ